ncbi:MAG: hypothetical protein GXZ04_00265 [Clostridiales bacterium]|nr:hypothetical protein [Clostridiales bacterium]
MKKTMIVILALMLTLSFTALAALVEEPVINPEFSKEEMKNLHGETVVIENEMNLMGDIELGYAFLVPEHMNGQEMKTQYPVDYLFGDNDILGALAICTCPNP